MTSKVAKDAASTGLGVIRDASAQSPGMVLAMLLVTGSSIYSAYTSMNLRSQFEATMALHKGEGHTSHVTYERLKDAMDPLRKSVELLTTRVDTLIASQK